MSSKAVLSLYELVDSGHIFQCIYADPPWKYGNQGTRASAGNYYSGMSVEEICAEPVAQLAAEKSVLFLWATSTFLPDSFEVIKAWGFDYKSNMVWVKPQLGIGNYVRLSHEHLLIATRGGLRTRGTNQISWIEANRTRHSKKPDVFRRTIESMVNGPYLELYGRERTKNWTVYGNQVDDKRQQSLPLKSE